MQRYILVAFDAMNMPEKTLRRRDNVNEKEKTTERDRCADWIEKEIINKDRWPMPKTEIAKLSKKELNDDGWSRQHISKVIQHYFDEEEIGESQIPKQYPDSIHINIDVPSDCEWESYVRGYLNGFKQSIIE